MPYGRTPKGGAKNSVQKQEKKKKKKSLTIERNVQMSVAHGKNLLPNNPAPVAEKQSRKNLLLKRLRVKYLKKKLPKSRTGEILDEMGGGPRGFSRSAKIKEVQTKPKSL